MLFQARRLRSLRIVALQVFLALALPASAAAHEMIAAANPIATQAGFEILRKGGSAADAAIAAQMVLTLVEPESSGIGGGAFLVIYDPAKKQVTSFDGRETAPASATPGMFLDANGKPRPHMDAVPGGLSVGVPGDIAVLELAHQRYGRLPWNELFDPAIRLAQRGFPVSPKLAAELREFGQTARMPDLKRYFYKPDGTPVRQGDVLKNPQLATTLSAIAKDGARTFYTGTIAQAIVDAVHQAPVNPGGMTLGDLAGYEAKERSPVCGTYRVYRVCSMGPPSSGGISLLQMLGILEQFPASALQPGTLRGLHLFAEASRLAFADRAMYIADPDVIHVPVAGLLDRHYLQERAGLINSDRDTGTAQAGNPPVEHALLEFAPQRTPQIPGTSHLSVVDAKGQVVSMTTTIEAPFGAEIMAKGFLLNNELTDFSFEPMRDGKPVANAPAPGKRPMSAMSPTIVFNTDGTFKIALGSPGGPFIIDYVAQALVALLDGGLSPQATAALPHVANLNGPTILEADTSVTEFASALAAMGHKVVLSPLPSGLHIVEQTGNGYIGGADPRRDGNVVGN
jgi:gamma-glutamyltranspeptidase/glutathione hydrolase